MQPLNLLLAMESYVSLMRSIPSFFQLGPPPERGQKNCVQNMIQVPADVMVLLRCMENIDNGGAEVEVDLDVKVSTDSDCASYRGCKMDVQQTRKEVAKEVENMDNADTA